MPDGSSGRVQGDELKYNEAAARVMKENGIAIDDLHAVAAGGSEGMQLPRNVHFSKEGYAALARSVVAAIGF